MMAILGSKSAIRYKIIAPRERLNRHELVSSNIKYAFYNRNLEDFAHDYDRHAELKLPRRNEVCAQRLDRFQQNEGDKKQCEGGKPSEATHRATKLRSFKLAIFLKKGFRTDRASASMTK